MVPGLNSLIHHEVQSQARKGGPLGRLIVDDMQNLGDWTGDGGPGSGTRFLFSKVFRWRLEARNLHTLERGQLEPYDIPYDP